MDCLELAGGRPFGFGGLELAGGSRVGLGGLELVGKNTFGFVRLELVEGSRFGFGDLELVGGSPFGFGGLGPLTMFTFLKIGDILKISKPGIPVGLLLTDFDPSITSFSFSWLAEEDEVKGDDVEDW